MTHLKRFKQISNFENVPNYQLNGNRKSNEVTTTMTWFLFMNSNFGDGLTFVKLLLKRFKFNYLKLTT